MQFKTLWEGYHEWLEANGLEHSHDNWRGYIKHITGNAIAVPPGMRLAHGRYAKSALVVASQHGAWWRLDRIVNSQRLGYG